ncbi:hypothetical protein SBX64_17510 [Vibrio rhizosphaerae]|uniref:Uncharacterized protein n=1 Tax=Vibrio rhizosphaerae TaxID=398736 RepID=A0ABU4IY57_9VIBR|nr:hypothetical protein [Vibrio rhizosphaerae]MDW6094340.1 hypothetical protein [Vibrio rhizosphaerae]
MLLEDQDFFVESVEFVLDAVAQDQVGNSRADIGIYLISLLIADQKLRSGSMLSDK